MKEQILALRAQGKTYAQIKAELGCSKSTISYHLGENQKQKTQDRTKTLRSQIRQYMKSLKEESGCTDCGGKFNYWIMEFDHKNDGDKLFNLGRFQERTNSMEVIVAEIEKCDIVCANCHKNRTHMRRLEKVQ